MLFGPFLFTPKCQKKNCEKKKYFIAGKIDKIITDIIVTRKLLTMVEDWRSRAVTQFLNSNQRRKGMKVFNYFKIH